MQALQGSTQHTFRQEARRWARGWVRHPPSDARHRVTHAARACATSALQKFRKSCSPTR